MLGGFTAPTNGERELIPKLFYVDSEGSCEEGNVFAVGSGGDYALGALERRLEEAKKRGGGGGAGGLPTLNSIDEGIELAVGAIRTAGARDGFSGGVCNVYLIDEVEDGDVQWKKIFSKDLGKRRKVEPEST
jgi:20S proteasome alpha/beta subunit